MHLVSIDIIERSRVVSPQLWVLSLLNVLVRKLVARIGSIISWGVRRWSIPSLELIMPIEWEMIPSKATQH